MPEGSTSAAPKAVISRYAKVARPILIECFGVKSCAESTRVTIECLKRFGVRAEVVPVSLRVKSAESGWVCGLTKQELKTLPSSIVDGCPPGQAWRGHHIAMAEGWGCRYLIDASFDQVRLVDVAIPPMVLYFETESAAPGDRLGTLRDFLYVELPVTVEETAIAEMLQLSYKQLEDRSFVNGSAQDIDSLQPVVNLICGRMMAS